jgi:catechol 2,3-dioxygenase-like lactoylglutathione lyase family enzyme
VVECACCGEERAAEHVAALSCHDDIKLCRVCLGWLRARAGVPDSTPTLPVTDIDRSRAFYESAGFDVREYEGGGFAFVEYEDESVFDLDLCSRITPETNGAGCYLIVRGVDEWHAQMSDAGLDVTPIEDQPWGMHEYTLTDPDGNHIRIGRTTDA